MRFLSLLLLPLALAYSNDLTVHTTSGTVQGFHPHNDISAFLGIPYGKIPLRFRPSIPYTSKKSLNASSFGPICHQFPGIANTEDVLLGGLVSSDLPESEDCLNLNVFAPKGSRHGLATMVFIHGGGFTVGTASVPIYDPTFLIRDSPDIIFVSLNYRLGPLGYPLSSAIPKNETNPGLLDQRLALEWVRDNIQNFGGDPKRITLFGESAGSVSVDFHSYGYRTDPIASGYIMQSGQVGLYDGSGPDANGTKFATVAELANCSSASDLECLQSPNLNITAIRDALNVANNNGGEPHIDGHTVLGKAEFARRAKAGLIANVPTLLGSNDNEADGLGLVTPPPANSSNSTVDYTASDAYTLSSFTCHAARAAEYRQQAGVPVWRYRWMPVFPSMKLTSWIRSFHGSELLWVFGSYRTMGVNPVDPPRKVEREAEIVVHKVWTEFAKNPKHGLDRKIGWPKYGAKRTLGVFFKDEVPTIGYAKNAGGYDKGCPATK